MESTGYREGFFCAAYALRNRTDVSEATLDLVKSHLLWFSAYLTIPDKFTSSRRKGQGWRVTRGLSWFRPDATEMLQRSFDLIHLLREEGYQIDMLRSDRIGRIVYEDRHQVVAEPFSDTPT
ncbi:hypothetical protein [Tabrizicola sp.]|uniref:hypothetical protein n=1 Tax=Tabrizicola sp. TaxID=2005166 RepID=UPI002FDE314A